LKVWERLYDGKWRHTAKVQRGCEHFQSIPLTFLDLFDVRAVCPENMFECKLKRNQPCVFPFFLSFFLKTRIGFYWGLSRRESRYDRDLKGTAFGCGRALKRQNFARNYSAITIFVVTLLLLFLSRSRCRCRC
jgi:hypothetical protein